MSILLSDMSSGLQVAAGLNLASAVLMQTHRQGLERYVEFIAYAREVASPRAKNDEGRDKLAFAAAALEQGMNQARFELYPVLKRLAALCLISGVITTICLFVPAFYQPSNMPLWSALVLAIGCFIPVVFSLLYVRHARKKTEKRLKPIQDQLQKTMTEALVTT